MKRCIFIILTLSLLACNRQEDRFTIEVLNAYTPVKNQGKSGTCWAYAMLSTIETEHIMKGDSVELSVAWVERMMKRDTLAPASKRGVALSLIREIERYGLVPFYAMRTIDEIPPHWAFLLGCQYTPLEFAHSVCAPDEYIGIGSNPHAPVYQFYIFDSPDNWHHAELLNVPTDSLLAITERAVRSHHGVCWEGDTSERGFDWKRGVARTSWVPSRTTDDHCMAIVGIARDEEGQPFFIMKNSWGTDNAQGGLLYMSFDYFREKTLAIVLPRACLGSLKVN